jgi:hypothetical protein
MTWRRQHGQLQRRSDVSCSHRLRQLRHVPTTTSREVFEAVENRVVDDWIRWAIR